jgi:capsular exopolysaccharide synthesis family protein
MFTLPGMKETAYPSGQPFHYNLRKIDPLYYELFKGLRAKIEYKIDMVELRILAVTSAIAGEGKTLTAIHLAANLASTGRKRILLVDLDLRKAGITRELGHTGGPGLSGYLSGDVSSEEILRPTSIQNLFLLPGGHTIPSPADMLAGERFRTLLRDLRERFDLLILDTPPILPVSDALTISDQVDAFILLFRLNHTPYRMFRQALEELGERKIMGVVLNGEEKKSEKYYTRYYGKYYQKSGTGDDRR